MTAAQGRALRVDAARNHERIAVAASEAFEELGPDASLEEVARRAGVGVATLYRRFGNRDTLVAAAFAHIMTTEIEPAIAIYTGDHWGDLAGALRGTVEVLAGHRVLIALAYEAGAVKVDVVNRYLTSMERLLGRAKGSGLVRPELRARDLGAVVVMALSMIHARDPDGADRRRYFALLLDGLRPSPTTLPEPAPDTPRP